MDSYQYDPISANANLIHKLYGDWDKLDKKPSREEVELVLSFAKRIDGPALSDPQVGCFQDVLLADREFWPTRIGQNQQWSQAKLPEKYKRLKQQLLKICSNSNVGADRNNRRATQDDEVAGIEENNESALKDLCTGTLFEFIVALFKGNVSLPMFRLYYTYLPRYKTLTQELFKASFGIDRELERFVGTGFGHYFDNTTVEWANFHKEVSALPKLADILRVLSLSVQDKGIRSSVVPGKVIIIKGYLRQWRIFKKQLGRDRQVLSYYGAWLYIWDSLIAREQDFQVAVEYGLLDNRHAVGTSSYTYDDFEWLVRSYRTRPDVVEESIYAFVRNLNEEYYIGNKFLRKPNFEEEVWFSKIGMKHPSIPMNDRRRKESIDRAQWAYSVVSLNCNEKSASPFIGTVIRLSEADGINMERSNSNNDTYTPGFQLETHQLSDSLTRFQGAVILCERNYPNSIEVIKTHQNAIKDGNSDSAIEYANNCLSDLMGSFKVVYDRHSSPGEKFIEMAEATGSSKSYLSLKMPSLYKLKKADFFISAQFATDYNIREPVVVNSDEISLFPVRREAFQWCAMHLEGNMYFEHIKQLYLNMIPDKESFTIADDNLILQGFTWDQWRSLLAEKDPTRQVPFSLLANCEKVLSSFHSFWGNLNRDMRTKRIYDPTTLYIGIFGAILATTQMFSMILAIIQVLQAGNIIKPTT
ncbi:unnamed protein product [Umbelopsis vinacea]